MSGVLFICRSIHNCEKIRGFRAAEKRIYSAGKKSETPANENNYLYGLSGEKRAISITIPSFAAGLSGTLQSGDIASIADIIVSYFYEKINSKF